MEPYLEMIYTVNFLDDNDHLTFGKDIVRLKYNGQEYYPWNIHTHDGLFIEYDEHGAIVKWIKQ